MKADRHMGNGNAAPKVSRHEYFIVADERSLVAAICVRSFGESSHLMYSCLRTSYASPRNLEHRHKQRQTDGDKLHSTELRHNDVFRQSSNKTSPIHQEAPAQLCANDLNLPRIIEDTVSPIPIQLLVSSLCVQCHNHRSCLLKTPIVASVTKNLRQ